MLPDWATTRSPSSLKLFSSVRTSATVYGWPDLEALPGLRMNVHPAYVPPPAVTPVNSWQKSSGNSTTLLRHPVNDRSCLDSNGDGHSGRCYGTTRPSLWAQLVLRGPSPRPLYLYNLDPEW